MQDGAVPCGAVSAGTLEAALQRHLLSCTLGRESPPHAAPATPAALAARSSPDAMRGGADVTGLARAMQRADVRAREEGEERDSHTLLCDLHAGLELLSLPPATGSLAFEGAPEAPPHAEAVPDSAAAWQQQGAPAAPQPAAPCEGESGAPAAGASPHGSIAVSLLRSKTTCSSGDACYAGLSPASHASSPAAAAAPLGNLTLLLRQLNADGGVRTPLLSSPPAGAAAACEAAGREGGALLLTHVVPECPAALSASPDSPLSDERLALWMAANPAHSADLSAALLAASQSPQLLATLRAPGAPSAAQSVGSTPPLAAVEAACTPPRLAAGNLGGPPRVPVDPHSPAHSALARVLQQPRAAPSMEPSSAGSPAAAPSPSAAPCDADLLQASQGGSQGQWLLSGGADIPALQQLQRLMAQHDPDLDDASPKASTADPPALELPAPADPPDLPLAAPLQRLSEWRGESSRSSVASLVQSACAENERLRARQSRAAPRVAAPSCVAPKELLQV